VTKDYYKVLGVEKNATKDDIKKAFRKLAGQHHPDRGGDEKKFKEVNEAYQILANDKKRAEYDTYGQTFSGATSGGPSGWDFSGFEGFSAEGGPASGWDLGDVFSDFFSGGAPFGRSSRTKRGADISIDLQISFADSIFGTERNVLITKNSTCATCNGSGARPGSELETCKRCSGRGKLRESRGTFFGNFTVETVCRDCSGRGKKPKDSCNTCGGAGIARKQEQIHIDIPAGIDNGEMIRMSGLGEAVSGGTQGDLYVKVHVNSHPTFKRQGTDIVMDLPVKLTDAILGATYDIETLDGKDTLKVPEGTPDGTVLKISGKGVPTARGKRGNLLVKVVIKMPSKISSKARDLISKLREEGI